ncbi:pentapeptide repeat-containing protein [Phenylobacterium sp.]|jgi:hypothetical protein|uniref:pentapeptide repeat-containing protein n=1 Tax=Phenylobacterium sp. TaxID=1871053 RepID=UPI0037834FBC
MTSASEAVFASQVRALAGADNPTFADAVRLSGLDPRYDFRHADLSGVDLRGQDLSAFDLSHAVLDYARVLGTRFNRTVSRKQLRRAIRTARAMAVLVGEHLLDDEALIAQRLGVEVYVPRGLNEALRRSERDRERRLQRTGAFIGDNSDLVRRRLAQAMKVATPAHGVSFVIAEPETDFDFDALGAVTNALERRSLRPFVFLLPHLMATEASGLGVVRARVRGFNADNLINFAAPEVDRSQGQVRNPARLAQQSLADLAKTLDFLLALSAATMVFRTGGLRGRILHEEGHPWLVRGARRGHENLATTIIRAVEEAQPRGGYGHLRRGVLLREDVMDPDLPTRIAGGFGARAAAVEVGTFPRREDDDFHFYALSGPPRSNVWRAFASRGYSN